MALFFQSVLLPIGSELCAVFVSLCCAGKREGLTQARGLKTVEEKGKEEWEIVEDKNSFYMKCL